MFYSNYHISDSKLHFSRWSNNSFAIFHSIGREVIIGMVSMLLENLITVKTHDSCGFLTFSTDDYHEEEGFDEIFEQINADEYLIELTNADTQTIRHQSSVSDSGTTKVHVIKFHNGSTSDLFLFAILYLSFKPFFFLTQNYCTK